MTEREEYELLQKEYDELPEEEKKRLEESEEEEIEDEQIEDEQKKALLIAQLKTIIKDLEEGYDGFLYLYNELIEAPLKPTLYKCDGYGCKRNCEENIYGECKHTTNIEHAVNFDKFVNCYVEKDK